MYLILHFHFLPLTLPFFHLLFFIDQFLVNHLSSLPLTKMAGVVTFLTFVMVMPNLNLTWDTVYPD
jgi:hypothetical protein